MNFATLVLSILAILENCAPIIEGYRHLPKGAVFLGTIHHPGDYFYYLSQVVQGARGAFLSTDLFTAEPVPETIIGWFNIFAGKIGAALSLSPIDTYHTLVVLLTCGVFLSFYFLAATTHNKRSTVTLSVFLFTIFHAFPALEKSGWTYTDYWNNIAVPFVRLGGVPHQLFSTILSILAASELMRKKPRPLVLFFIGALLSSLQPVLCIFLAFISCCAVLLSERPTRWDTRTAIRLLLPTAFFFVGGVGPLFVLLTLFRSHPFSQLKAWESAQVQTFSLLHFLKATGPVFVVSLLSLPAFLSQRTYNRIFLALFPLLSIILFFSPLPTAFGVPPIRFMTPLVVVCLSLIAAHGIATRKLLVQLALYGMLLILVVPSHIKSISLSTSFDPTNAYQYLSSSDYRFLMDAAKLLSKTDTTLVIWPYNTIFPGLTGKRSYHGHSLLTINAQEKDAIAQSVFDGTRSQEDVKALLKSSHITAIIGYSWTPNLASYSFLRPVITTQTLILYKVIPFN